MKMTQFGLSNWDIEMSLSIPLPPVSQVGYKCTYIRVPRTSLKCLTFNEGEAQKWQPQFPKIVLALDPRGDLFFPKQRMNFESLMSQKI